MGTAVGTDVCISVATGAGREGVVGCDHGRTGRVWRRRIRGGGGMEVTGPTITAIHTTQGDTTAFDTTAVAMSTFALGAMILRLPRTLAISWAPEGLRPTVVAAVEAAVAWERRESSK